MRDRTMPANQGKGVIEYVAKCCCAGKYREGWVFFYILICKTETIFNCEYRDQLQLRTLLEKLAQIKLIANGR